VTVSDVDNTMLVSASVHISAGTFTADGRRACVGACLAGTSILANYNAATETLTLSGTTPGALQPGARTPHVQSPRDPTMAPQPDPDRGLAVNDGSATDNLAAFRPPRCICQAAAHLGAAAKAAGERFDGDGPYDSVAERRWHAGNLVDQRTSSSRGEMSDVNPAQIA